MYLDRFYCSWFTRVYLLNRIDRKILKDTLDLFNKINKYEHMVNINNEEKIRNLALPCKNYEKLNKGIHYHNESVCWFKTKKK